MATSTTDFIRRRTSIADNIAHDLRERIRSGGYPVGSRLVGRREMAAKYGVAQMAVQQAMNMLMAEGVVRAESGRGTYVAKLPDSVATSEQSPIRRPRSNEPTDLSHLTIAVISPQWCDDPTFQGRDDDWPGAILRSFEWKVSSAIGARLRYVDCYDLLMRGDHESVARSIDDDVAALAIITFDSAAMATATTVAENATIPVVRVVIGERPFGRQPCVFYDNAYAGYQAARHLIASGYETITTFCPFAEKWWSESRLSGVREAIAESGSDFSQITVEGDLPEPDECNQTEFAYEKAPPFLARLGENCGVVAINDHAGYGLLKAAQEVGMQAGRDFGLVGFDDRSPSRKFDMTSLHPPLDAMGGEAAKLLLMHIEGDRATAEVRLQSHLVVRGSTRRLRGAVESVA